MQVKIFLKLTRCIFGSKHGDNCIKENFKGVLFSLAVKSEEDGDPLDSKALYDALSLTGNEFKDEVDEAILSVKLSAIIEDLNKGKIRLDAGLEKIADLYFKLPNNDHICHNLALVCISCINKYSPSSNHRVGELLDRIIDRKSDTFRKYSSLFYDAYVDIWKQLSKTTRCTLLVVGLGNNNLDIKLTEQGIMLYCRLNWYKRFGDFKDLSIDWPFDDMNDTNNINSKTGSLRKALEMCRSLHPFDNL